MRSVLFILALLAQGGLFAQFAPQAGLSGSTAIPASSAAFTGWAASCTVQRGYIDIADASAGLVTAGEAAFGTGAPDGNIVSLGDSGVAVLTFTGSIYNGEGPDFAVFENGFKNPSDPSMAFLELAFVEVSSDGANYYRFPASCNVQATTQIPGSGVYTDASLVNNLAGKYIAGYGTPFDLTELAGITGLDVNHITHVRIVDVVGAISGHSSKDKEGNIINDPYPTNFPTGGFDLEAVGAINFASTAVGGVANTLAANLFPNPATDVVTVRLPANAATGAWLQVMTATGQEVMRVQMNSASAALNVSAFPAGVYFISISNDMGNRWSGKLVKY